MKNIEENAVIKVTNKQTFSDHEECIEITSIGKFYLKNGKFYILYKEYAEIGEVSVMVKADGNNVTIRRRGASNATMNYSEGHSEEVLYKIPYGDIVFELRTNFVDNRLSENGGVLVIDYDLVLNHEAYNNEITIEIERKESK